jgi:hypothetical protein
MLRKVVRTYSETYLEKYAGKEGCTIVCSSLIASIAQHQKKSLEKV